MKDNSLDGHRGKVAVSDTTRNLAQQSGSSSSSTTNVGNTNSSSASSAGKCDLKGSPSSASSVTTATVGGGGVNSNDGPSATNFDDDYNEWELGIGDLIIDLDADIEKTNERNSANLQHIPPHHHAQNHSGHHHHHQNGSISSSVPPSPSSSAATSIIASSPTANSTSALSFLGTQAATSPCGNPVAAAMSNSKSSRAIGSAGTCVAVTSASSSSGSCTIASGINSCSTAGASGGPGVSQAVSGAVEHQATVDKGLKMKIKRKTVGNKYSEAKHEIVQSDTKSPMSSSEGSGSSSTGVSSANCVGGQATGAGAASNDTPKSKHSSSKGRNNSHREKKEKNREKDKNSGNVRTNSSVEMNGVLGVMSPSLKITNSGLNLSNPGTPTASGTTSASSPVSSQNGAANSSNGTVVNNGAVAGNVQTSRCGAGSANATVIGSSGQTLTTSISSTPSSTSSGTTGSDCLQQTFSPASASAYSGSSVSNTVPQAISLSNSPPMPNLTLKLENSKFSPTTTPCSVVVKQEEMPTSPPSKRLKVESCDSDAEVTAAGSPVPPEMKDTSTCTSVGTITEPDCLGPCEPGTSVMLEGIVWQETEGGVLVVNVTWRGKTYVGTLLDCTKHDWAPPRFCESPTSDVDAKTTKGRGKRGRGANSNCNDVSAFDARNCVQSKLRNGKGRRTTINSSSNFTVPSSPAKSDSSGSNSKRKGRPADLEIAQQPQSSDSSGSSSNNGKTPKRSRLQSRGTPTPSGGSSNSNSCEFPQPSSPVLIECPEPNCSKKYKHINGLRYHQQHAHSGSSDGGNKLDDTATEDSKDVTNSSDNEESTQENMSVPPSPAMSFANSVSPHPGTAKVPAENNSSSSSAQSLPAESESSYGSLTQDLTTLASVAVGNTKTAAQKPCSSTRTTPTIPATSQASLELPVIVAPTESAKAASPSSVLQNASCGASISSSLPADLVHSPTGPAAAPATNSVIHASESDSSLAPSTAVTVSIPTSHVVFNQGIAGAGASCITNSTTPTTTLSMSCHSSASLPSPRPASMSSINASPYVPVVSSVSSVSSIPSPTAAVDKSKPKPQQQQQQPPPQPQQQQQHMDSRQDKYKPKSPVATPAIRPIVPAPTPQLIALSSNIPSSLSGVGVGNHGLVTSSLKPIQPKPTILGEPSNVNPALESLKKEKSKHKKKSKDKDRKPGSLPLSAVKMPGEECEPMDASPYPSLEAMSGGREPLGPGLAPTAATLPGGPHSALALDGQKPPGSSLDLTLVDDTVNDNVQSPAYSDISDANDTAPVLESEVASVKEKEDKIGKSTPDAAQSPATNISAYGMYPYYSQPPYLLPSVSPQSSAPGSQAAVIEKQEQQKKMEQERMKENRPWSNPGGDMRERISGESELVDKKPLRENSTPNSTVISSPAAAAAAANQSLQEYQMQQPYPYSYGYVQGYPYAVEQNYHMHLLESDPHYKQQYKQYIEDQQRLYKEQQQQQQQQQHHHQQQQQQQQQQHHGHQQQQHSQHHQQQLQQHHHSQHQSHHQNKIHHSSMLKDDRDRRDQHKDSRLISDKIGSAYGEHISSKMQQHSSVSLAASVKDHDPRDQSDGRPPSLPTQIRSENSTPSASAIKEKQGDGHQGMKENIEMKSQIEDKSKINQFEMAMLYERHREDMRRYYLLHERMHERMIEQQQQKMEPGYHHHTHHHQTIQAHQLPSHSLPSMKSHKDDMTPGGGPATGHSKAGVYDSGRSGSVMSPAKSEYAKMSASSHPHNSSSPKGSIRESAASMPKEYSGSSSSRDSSTSRKDGVSGKSSDRSDGGSGRDEKLKTEKIKTESKPEPEGQKPTMETTGPPPPPTNAYAYLHPSYLQPPPPHFPHMPFEPAHAVYRGALNPMIMSTPSYGSSPYMHPQLRYVPPGACEMPAHSQPSDPLGKGLHPPGPPKALDLLHQVSQHYTTHKIHELQEHALMSPTPTSTPVSSTTPSTSSSTVNCKVSTAETTTTVSKVDAASNRDSSRSPPTQRHLHTHHHTHVGVGYPIYDPYGAIIAPPAPVVEAKPIHPLHPVKTPPTGRYWQ